MIHIVLGIDQGVILDARVHGGKINQGHNKCYYKKWVKEISINLSKM